MSPPTNTNGVSLSADDAVNLVPDKKKTGDAATAATAVLKPSIPMPSTSTKIRGVDFNDYKTPITVQQLTSHLARTGFQASSLGRAVEIINNMVHSLVTLTKIQRSWTPGSLPPDPDDEDKAPPPPDAKCTIFLGFTSNLISSGLRETLRYCVEHRHVNCVVTTAGGIEEDIIKCLAPTFLGSFTTPGAQLREGGLNRIGNLVVPNDNYCSFEDWLTPILDKMLDEQETEGTRWTPSKMIRRLGKEINHEDSVLYWAYKVHFPR
jgi:deoxyhypusine synthase